MTESEGPHLSDSFVRNAAPRAANFPGIQSLEVLTYTVYDKYVDENYVFTVDGTVGNSADTSIYMSRDTFNAAFGEAGDWFNAYASDDDLAIEPDYLVSVTTPQDMQKLADQLLESFSSIVEVILGAAAIVYFVVMYLLTKIVFDHSARAISHLKVFGYRDREIRGLYVRTITSAVAVSLVAVLAPAMWSVSAVFDAIMLSYSGNYTVAFTPAGTAECLAIGFGVYLVVVAALHIRRIKRIPLELALKTQE